jgi:hypothetical protein
LLIYQLPYFTSRMVIQQYINNRHHKNYFKLSTLLITPYWIGLGPWVIQIFQFHHATRADIYKTTAFKLQLLTYITTNTPPLALCTVKTNKNIYNLHTSIITGYILYNIRLLSGISNIGFQTHRPLLPLPLITDKNVCQPAD